MEAFEIKIRPIIIKEGPSKKVKIFLYIKCITFLLPLKANYKIQGAKIQYDIYFLCLRLRDTTFKAEHEQKVL